MAPLNPKTSNKLIQILSGIVTSIKKNLMIFDDFYFTLYNLLF